MSDVSVEKNGATLVITLDNPEVKNAINLGMQNELTSALREASRDLEVRAVVLTGGGDVFCSGTDTRQISNKKGVFEGTSAPRTRHGYTHGIQQMSKAFFDCEVPIIAAVNGPAIGLGFDLTIQCDIRIASENASFSEAFITFGLIPGDGGFWYLPRIVGYSRAVEMTITGKRIDAATAESWGLVSQVVPKGDSLTEALALAEQIAKRPPQTVRLSKKLIRDADQLSFHEALDLGAMAQAVLTGSDDQQESAAAMRERRDGNYQSR
ncbi:MAG: enoyl-CoA hydratase [Gammaproteobacteria bacterium]|jgi:enoyl-CoA hydratase/carnithine racemase|nr:enoyl-CoA hydratase [Gammaproteobacteria bacterium]MBT4494188.1 enoyl-CoA hydratase [Gammaproteobacteria bacterium]MBT7372145.1 enoyl-CoA hydratase [Gammaproteobacteria bacterium]